VAVADIQAKPLEALLAEMPGRQGSHVAVPFDLADGAACQASVRSVQSGLGGLDILIHAGALLRRESLAQVSTATLHEITAVNMWGTFFVARTAALLMAERAGGSIVLFSSQGAYTGGFGSSTVYAMTKAAVNALIKSLAREFGTRNVRVNGIAPGGIDTPMMQGLSPEALRQFTDMIPMGRMGDADEVACCCAFLASSASRYVTGQVLHVNGGQLML
jgi:NAD(P)-dependent dehydrogenase (short-subunit alcohol dehydrogenase family)